MLISLLTYFVLVITTILIHYETLFQLAQKLVQIKIVHRYKVLFAVMVIMVAHLLEICLFALGYYLLIHLDDYGSMLGNTTLTFNDCAYFSFTSYTTLGYGDIEPTGHLRFLAGLESLTGLVMITWSASFVFLEMQRYWPKR